MLYPSSFPTSFIAAIFPISLGTPHSLMALHSAPLKVTSTRMKMIHQSHDFLSPHNFYFTPTLTDHGHILEILSTPVISPPLHSSSGHFYLMSLSPGSSSTSSLSNKFFIIHYASIAFPPPTQFSLHSPSWIFIPLVITLFSFAPLSFCCTCLAKCQPKLNTTIYLHHACT